MATEYRNHKPDSFRRPPKITRIPSPTESEKPKLKANLILSVHGERFVFEVGIHYAAPEPPSCEYEEFHVVWMRRAYVKGPTQWVSNLSIRNHVFTTLAEVLREGEAVALEYEASCEDELIEAANNNHTYYTAPTHLPSYTRATPTREEGHDWTDLIPF